MTLVTWLVEPLEPLLFGDGRPATAVAGLVSPSRPMPPPTQLAGVVRTRSGLDASGQFDSSKIDALLERQILGPHLARFDKDGEAEWLFPAPADAWVKEDGAAHPFVPLELAPGEATSAPGVPVGLTTRRAGKPWKDAPRWWQASETLGWLSEARPRAIVGTKAPVEARRTHVSVNAETGTAADSALFGTAGRVFDRPDGRLGLALRTDADMPEGLAPLGGERRMARWRRSDLAFPAIPDAVLSSARDGAVRVLWVTPALFSAGSRPSYLVADAPAGSEWVAQANDRPEVVSGWDFRKKEPKPTRRLLPAGSVTWLRLGGDADAREAWARRVWGAALSDDEQARRDGLGVVLLGVWDGALSPFTAT